MDMDTSGVLLAAKTAAAATSASAQFRQRTVSKAYLAIAVGVPSRREFDVDGAIGQHPDVLVARHVVPAGSTGLPALTHVTVLSTNDAAPLWPVSGDRSQHMRSWGPAAPDRASLSHGACLVCCRPVTGRTHQIRVHMAAAGHPLVGDDVYGLQVCAHGAAPQYG